MPIAEGKIFNFDKPDQIRTDFLECFDFESSNQYILIESDEFSCVCPFSGLPDYGTLRVEYYPEGGKCVELKSLKYYTVSFRPIGIYQEAVTQRIYQDLKNLLNTSRIKVTTLYQPRGGFKTTCIEGCLCQE